MSSHLESISSKIEGFLKKRGVTIYLDDDNSQIAQMGTPYSWDQKNRILRIWVSELGKKDRTLTKKIIQKVFEADGLLWNKDKEAILVEYGEYHSKDPYAEILTFFEGILPPNDFSALKMSFFLRSQSEKGKNVEALKENIRERFGDRGNNIANLCSAGYFEEEFKPLYLAVSTADFNDYYNRVVGEKARALFINRNMTAEDIKNKIEKMIQKAIKYHMDDFRVHAKGKGNISLIKKIVDEMKNKEKYTMERTYVDPKLEAIEYTFKIKR